MKPKSKFAVLRRCARAIVHRARFFGLLALCVGAMSVARAAKGERPAKLEISGLGWWGDWQMRVSLERLLGAERGPTLPANAVEDALFLLLSSVQEDGFLKPRIDVELTIDSGPPIKLTLDADLNVTVPRDLAARRAHFRVTRGTRYYVDKLQVNGLHAVPEKVARGFFVGESALFTGKAVRAYTPSRLARGVESLRTELQQRGYAEAAVRADGVHVDDRTGAVGLTIEVAEGAPWIVAATHAEIVAGGGDNDAERAAAVGEAQPDDEIEALLKRFVGEPWSDSLQQDAAADVRKAFFARGYPDVRVRLVQETGALVAGHKPVALTVRVRPGERVTMGAVKFAGAADVRESVLQRRIHEKVGEPLDVLEIEQARYRISRLGVFDRVDVKFDPEEGPVRSPVFTLQPGKRMEVNLLGGYGTYEELRGGVEVRQYNLFGLAHQTRGLLVESMKSTRGEYSYTVPELLGESIDGSAKLFGLQRQEVAFERQEYGATVALAAPIAFLGAKATADYTFQALRNRNNQLETQSIDNKQVTVASLEVGLTRDRRDNPLVPRKGYRWFGQIEAASRGLGGEAEYQRIEAGGSYHTGWGEGRWLHLSAAHGVITTWGTTDELLPVNKRFFPGGDGSIRGYRTGEASPRGADGKFVGAKSYMSGSVELEQALAPKWSFVIFGDAVGTATQLRHYPFDETLFAAGAGVRFQTLIGPLRLEYGRNLKRRLGDPTGTWLLSIGFPF
ncbi:MAG TPA: BamA/TamA family outer membrane protein [Opitutaceae bacterium]|nr:BamA/TamA family outer membrane protein [Opitutaceae bacterium]